MARPPRRQWQRRCFGPGTHVARMSSKTKYGDAKNRAITSATMSSRDAAVDDEPVAECDWMTTKLRLESNSVLVVPATARLAAGTSATHEVEPKRE